jgi:hypothetical protein
VTGRGIQAHSSNWGEPFEVTKVLRKTASLWSVLGLWAGFLGARTACASDNSPAKPAEVLYLQLGQVGLDARRVYTVRDASLDRSAIHISLEDGTIAFTQDVMGRITGAFFEGDGEVLLEPPNDVERRSMSLFTGMAILEEHFATAYFRFNDDVFSDLRPDLRQTENKQEFVDRWNSTARNLAGADAMRLLLSFSSMLPVNGKNSPSEKLGAPGQSDDRFLHVRLQGTKLGVFDLSFDSLAGEQIQAGQARSAENGTTYYDVWTSFTPIHPTSTHATVTAAAAGEKQAPWKDWVTVRRYTISTEVRPPKEIHADAQLQCEVNNGGSRILLFELSRFLRVESVKFDGDAVEFIHNPAVEGTQLSRRGNEMLAVILPEPARTGQKLNLEFVYGGEVLEEAGSGLLYVGERGTWYPNRGLVMADFNLRFAYPAGWTLVATGKPVADAAKPENAEGLQRSRWVSDRPIPLAGFNLGKYKIAKTEGGNVRVETYATTGVERNFPSAPVQAAQSSNPAEPLQVPHLIVPERPSPALTEAKVGAAAAQAIQYFSQRFGPYPYSQLVLTQLPGNESQGWPALIFLSSYEFLNQQEREQLHLSPDQILIQQIVPAHETAHQWWGDLVTWNSYRDQWFSEGLANYCALMMLQEKDPAAFHRVMESYRRDLLEKNKEGLARKDAGPVTLGVRLLSSRFPEGYEAISYGRATWLFHMLRTMMQDAYAQEHGGKIPNGPDEPFVRGLRRIREKYSGKSITTGELLDALAEDLPPALRYEGKRSLDWFLEGWVNGTALPKLELKSVRITAKGSAASVSGTLLQKDAPPDLVTSVPLYAVISAKQSVLLGRVFADGAESSFHIAAPAGTKKILVDPHETLLTSPK